MLRHAGHTVEIAGSGEQALRTGPTFDPQVVLLDLGMPGMDGFETARRIRQQRWGQGIVLVAVTGWGLPEDRRRTQAAGFNAHMVKPVNDDELLRALGELLARPSA
jgi:CheY-like chemotaxis protein